MATQYCSSFGLLKCGATTYLQRVDRRVSSTATRNVVGSSSSGTDAGTAGTSTSSSPLLASASASAWDDRSRVIEIFTSTSGSRCMAYTTSSTASCDRPWSGASSTRRAFRCTSTVPLARCPMCVMPARSKPGSIAGVTCGSWSSVWSFHQRACTMHCSSDMALSAACKWPLLALMSTLASTGRTVPFVSGTMSRRVVKSDGRTVMMGSPK
mmetsp:Transcript_48676/g.150294  ORF Transcript_48676/g.150294 Transcript_48676/m.150294 type:complete len:211 (-) Transcript_48676:393-1025(-)